MTIYFMDRQTAKKKEELVAGLEFLQWLYQTKSGALFLPIVKRRFLSRLYGAFQDSFYSRRGIPRFVQEFKIDLSEAMQEDPASYRSFNDFFIRRLKPEARPIPQQPEVFVSPADGRLLAWARIQQHQVLQVKGFTYSLGDLLQDEGLATKYDGGTCLVFRLNPTDYHRFHFPDSGTAGESRSISGHYFSVNPLAIQKIQRLYTENKREWTLFHSQHFGDLLFVEVGATFVGSIVQTYLPGQPVHKGDEKGYFKFGGSTVILLLEPGALALDADILENSLSGLETKVLMGERIGVKPSQSE